MHHGSFRTEIKFSEVKFSGKNAQHTRTYPCVTISSSYEALI